MSAKVILVRRSMVLGVGLSVLLSTRNPSGVSTAADPSNFSFGDLAIYAPCALSGLRVRPFAGAGEFAGEFFWLAATCLALRR
jgi:hypothetical protein